MEGDFILHMNYIVGDRMIDYGVDALSRGCPTEGVMSGESILSFLPLHRSVKERSQGVVSWIRSRWTRGEALFRIQPKDWF